ncbi:hypothetical protein ABZZ74_53525, partial [Streptomyces sp. NPDC006476]
MTVERGLLGQRVADFGSHVAGGFSRLEQLGVPQDIWRARVDAVERARQSGNPVLVDSALREYTDLVERHLPPEVVIGEGGSRPFDAHVEQLRRELATVGDPTQRALLQDELSWHQDVRERLDRLAQSDLEAAVMRRRAIVQEEQARTPEEAAQARQALQEFQREGELRQQFDELRQGNAQQRAEARFEALRSAVAPDARAEELRQRVDTAATLEERARALEDLAAHNQLASQERRLAELRTSLPDPHREELVRQVEQAVTPEEARRAERALRQYMDRRVAEQQHRLTERLHSEADARTQAQNADVLRRIDASHGGTPQDPREAELRQRVDTATTEQERSQALHDLAVHRQRVLQQRVDNAATSLERWRALDEQAVFNNWIPQERRLAVLRTALPGGGAPEADVRHAELLRQVEQARSPEEARRAEQALKGHTDRRIAEQQRQLEERLRGSGGPRGGAATEEALGRFEALRGEGTHLDPREAEMMRRMEAAETPEEASSAEQALREYLGTRQQQRLAQEQQRLAQVRAHEQEVATLRERLTRQLTTGTPEQMERTREQLEQARARLTASRTHDEIAAALRHELDRSDTDSRGADAGPGSGGRLDRLVQEGLTRHAEQQPRPGAEKPAAPGPDHEAEHWSKTEIDDLPSAPTGLLPRSGDPAGTPVPDTHAAGDPTPAERHPDTPAPSHPTPAEPPAAPPGSRSPGSETSQLQAEHPRPAAPREETELPSVPTAATRVARATMPSRVPRIDDLDKTLAQLDAADGLRREPVTEVERPAKHAKTQTGNAADRDPAGDPPPTTPTTTGEEPPRQTDTGQPGPHSP